MPCIRRHPGTSAQARRHKMLIVLTARGIDEMNRGDIAFAAVRRRYSALAADSQGARRKTAVGECAYDHVECYVMAAHDHQVWRASGTANERHARNAVGFEDRCKRIDFEEAIRLRETGDRPGALSNRKCDRPPITLDQRYKHELFAAEFGATRTGTRALIVSAASGGRPARARMIGATKV